MHFLLGRVGAVANQRPQGAVSLRGLPSFAPVPDRPAGGLRFGPYGFSAPQVRGPAGGLGYLFPGHWPREAPPDSGGDPAPPPASGSGGLPEARLPEIDIIETNDTLRTNNNALVLYLANILH